MALPPHPSGRLRGSSNTGVLPPRDGRQYAPPQRLVAHPGDAPRSAPTNPETTSPAAPVSTRRSPSDDERRHACEVCGKAFNRPSSLAIHVNTHTGAKRKSVSSHNAGSRADGSFSAFVCPFPGCGRRFNVNSNMRRHLRNHTSPARPLNTAAPYTYPLTTVPRSLHPSASPMSSSSLGHPPIAVYTRGSDTGSDEDELSESESASYRQENEHEVEVARTAIDRLRLRAYSTSNLPAQQNPSRSPQFSPRARQSVLHRARSHSCTVPGCACGRPAALHPSSDSHRSRGTR